MHEADCLYEHAAPDALLCVGGGSTLCIGSLEQIDGEALAVFYPEPTLACLSAVSR